MESHLLELESALKGMKSIAVAFSGGLDSRFLAYTAIRCGCHVIALHAHGPHIAQYETEFAKKWAKDHDLPLLELDFNPLEQEDAANGSRLRCYACKKELFIRMRRLLREHGNINCVLCDGGNADDRTAYRPGFKAAAEAGVTSPLADAGLTKPHIRKFARESGLDRAEQAPRPCLLTRFAYGVKPDGQTLAALSGAEEAIGQALGKKRIHADFRLRLLPRPELHIDTPVPDIEADILAMLEKYGFRGAKLKVFQSISGFFDKKQKDITYVKRHCSL